MGLVQRKVAGAEQTKKNREAPLAPLGLEAHGALLAKQVSAVMGKAYSYRTKDPC